MLNLSKCIHLIWES